MYVPLILGGLGEKDRRRSFAEMGKPVTVVNAVLFQRRYDKRHLWSR